MDHIPTDLKLDDGNLLIKWNDSSDQSISIRDLRSRCPCANCRDDRSSKPDSGNSGLPVLSPEQAQPLSITRMEPAGNYAYTIHFSDGHDKGIFTFEFLRSFGD